MKQFRTVKRRAKVGECILITNVDPQEYRYKNGDVLTVTSVKLGGVYANEDWLVWNYEYEVIEEENEMDIENIADQQLWAVVTDDGEVYQLYQKFADASGHPDAVGHTAPLQRNDTVKLLAKGRHDLRDKIIYVVASDRGTKHLIGERGLRMIEAKQLTDYSYEELLDAIKAKAQAEVTPKLPGLEVSAELLARVNSHRTFQQQRDSIIEQAKRDVAELSVTEIFSTVPTLSGGMMSFYPIGCSKEYEATDEVQFIVNNEKRTVVALIKWLGSSDVWAKGIAKCAPTDCFNAHIGKAIALRRALGLDVPAEYLNAPQPTEVRVGDRIYLEFNGETETVSGFNYGGYTLTHESPGCVDKDDYKIIDDSREGE